ncbi:hypothetical protein C8R44DRAFT_732700 [Mycena epipterygia]|nr:hypothetical protein C8R44DRAFT_732700 [Mycena epipterygia]
MPRKKKVWFLPLDIRFSLMAPPHFNADIFLQIFALTDVYTILSLSRVTRLFHSAAFTKQPWLFFARDLASRWLIDPPEDEILETLSTDELINEVKREVITLQELPHGDFLPGGRHIVYYNRIDAGGAFCKGVECWEIRTGLRVWGWVLPDHIVHRARFDFRRGGSEAVVSLVNIRHAHNHIIILEVDLETGDSRDAFHLPIDALFPPRVHISGDFIACEALVDRAGWPSIVALVNWRTGQFIVFDPVNDQVLENGAPLCFLDTSLNNPSDTIRISYVVKDLEVSVICADPWCHRVGISVAESPLHDDTYELLASVVNSASPSRVKLLWK